MEEHKEKVRQYSKEYYQKNREKKLQYAKNHRKPEIYKKRIEGYRREWFSIIEEMGYDLKCLEYGYRKNFSVIDFHYRKPEEKEFQISKIFGTKLTLEKIQRVEEETKKCDILCNRCHGELYHPNCEIE